MRIWVILSSPRLPVRQLILLSKKPVTTFIKDAIHHGSERAAIKGEGIRSLHTYLTITFVLRGIEA